MSNAHLSAGLFRFFAVVAAAPFIALMLGMGCHAEQTSSVSMGSACYSKSLRNPMPHHPRGTLFAQALTDKCRGCVDAETNICMGQHNYASGQCDLTCQMQCENDALDTCIKDKECFK